MINISENIRELILTICASITSVITLISYIPQLIKSLRTKKTDDLPIGSWILWVVGAIVWEIYAIVDGGIALFISQTLELLFISSTLILAVLYRKK